MKKVLIATDFSTAADGLLNCVAELKQMGMEEALLVHVIDIRIGEGSILHLQQSGRKKLEEIAKGLEGYGIKTKLYTPIGFAATEIVQIARAEDASLILIGSRGRGVIKEVFIGSTTFDVIRLSNVPVLVEKYIKNKDQKYVNACIDKFQKILLPIDFSECSRGIVKEVKEMANVVQEVVLLSVVEQGESYQELEKVKDHVRAKINDLVMEFEVLGIAAKGIVQAGIPSKCIVELAGKEKVTSIMMGTRGKGLIKSLLLGSTSDAVARTAKRAVILIPCSK
ncbi:universal stress protein [Alkaliphilus hydrothermalis]|uniref:Nucleotide-binding universal stress UspA family protein n=1 Tax=Alkaliphilus hydrothermalis TaxID=1482730 RepID=A0ABS2NQ38_9FIRM|nr:universal stress protein [Alkaliphilus hydrothermalis]MBM7615019.1 nucleotide-binding universal stress UspA family protein [Alkaliphilus hydrothermalis]